MVFLDHTGLAENLIIMDMVTSLMDTDQLLGRKSDILMNRSVNAACSCITPEYVSNIVSKCQKHVT